MQCIIVCTVSFWTALFIPPGAADRLFVDRNRVLVCFFGVIFFLRGFLGVRGLRVCFPRRLLLHRTVPQVVQVGGTKVEIV